MALSYTRVNWVNYPTTTTPVNAENLNIMDAAISAATTQINTNTTDITTLNSNIIYDVNAWDTSRFSASAKAFVKKHEITITGFVTVLFSSSTPESYPLILCESISSLTSLYSTYPIIGIAVTHSGLCGYIYPDVSYPYAFKVYFGTSSSLAVNEIIYFSFIIPLNR